MCNGQYALAGLRAVGAWPGRRACVAGGVAGVGRAGAGARTQRGRGGETPTPTPRHAFGCRPAAVPAVPDACAFYDEWHNGDFSPQLMNVWMGLATHASLVLEPLNACSTIAFSQVRQLAYALTLGCRPKDPSQRLQLKVKGERPATIVVEVRKRAGADESPLPGSELQTQSSMDVLQVRVVAPQSFAVAL